MAYGIFATGLVLGWAALFARPAWRGLLVWAAVLAVLAAIAPAPLIAAAGIAGGALAHLILQMGLEGRRDDA